MANEMTTFLNPLLSPYRARKLNPDDGYKPLDFGGHGINGSLNRDGRIIAINTYHPQQGYITLTSTPPFPDDQRYDPDSVRRYRASLVEETGFGLQFDLSIIQREAWLLEDAIPHIRLTLEGGIIAEVTTFVTPAQFANVVQLWAFSQVGRYASFTGRVWLRRCAYTQLTEGGPLPPVSHETQVFQDETFQIVGVQNDALPAVCYLNARVDEHPQPDGSLTLDPGDLKYPQVIMQDTPEMTDHSLIYSVDHDQRRALTTFLAMSSRNMAGLLRRALDEWRERWQGSIPIDEDNMLLRRGLVYSFNCAVPVDDDATCFLTDHMLLPLSWNRDAYYAARALMNWGQFDLVRRHLIWMFERAERINGAWGRAYLANGAVKDRGFQLDQQLFPLLELAEYLIETGDDATQDRLYPFIQPLIDTLLTRKAGQTWLFPTDETPADDPIAYPYHLSSHILMWRVFILLDRLGLYREAVAVAAAVRRAIDLYFIAPYNGVKIYAYATDGNGNHHFYHDANDIPLALAPEWGLLPPDDPIWRATVDFAFGAGNAGGVYNGQLGSVHTPAPWPLGDIQEALIARALGDSPREQAARERLNQAAQWDGALPEAYDPASGAVISRNWFVWPNAMHTYLGE